MFYIEVQIFHNHPSGKSIYLWLTQLNASSFGVISLLPYLFSFFFELENEMLSSFILTHRGLETLNYMSSPRAGMTLSL